MSTLARQPNEPPAADRFAVRHINYEAEVRQPRHHHDGTTATLVLEGSLEEVVGSKHEEARPLSVVFKPAGTEHANRIGPEGATTLQLAFGRAFLAGCGQEPTESDWGWTHGGEPARRFVELFTEWRAGRSDAFVLEAHVLDLLAALRESPAERRGAPDWLRRAVEEIEDTFEAPRRVRDLAADASVHPVALARAHRRHFGCSISDRIRRRRVSAAAALLGRDLPPSRAAHRTGFSDQSHLTRVFKAETGVTPGRYRELLRD